MRAFCRIEVVKAKFYGKEIRGIRRHYAWLRRRLQERGLTKVVKRIGKKEKRSVNPILHRVSKGIVSLADSADSYIVLGDLTGIREKKRGKRFNRIVSNIREYEKAKEKGNLRLVSIEDFEKRK